MAWLIYEHSHKRECQQLILKCVYDIYNQILKLKLANNLQSFFFLHMYSNNYYEATRDRRIKIVETEVAICYIPP